jgi:hypothetical protein
LKELAKRYIHLTNYSVNKNSSKFVKNKDPNIDNIGNKWSLTALKKKYKELEINSEELWRNIKDIIIKTCIAVEPYMSDMYLKC